MRGQRTIHVKTTGQLLVMSSLLKSIPHGCQVQLLSQH